MDWTAFMFSLPLAAVRTAHLTFAITEICRPDDGRSRPVATAGLQVLRSSASRFKTKLAQRFGQYRRGLTGCLFRGGDQRCWAAQAQGVSSASRRLGQLLTSLVSTSAK